jgi:hypothetical protein
LSALIGYYKQEPHTLVANASTTQNVQAITIGITGPASAEYDILWDGSIRRANGALNPSGLATESQLPGGYYIVRLYHPTAYDSYLVPQDVTLTGSASAVLNFGTTYNAVTAGTGDVATGRIYAYDLSGAAGATIWRRLVTGEWQAWASTDSAGDYFASGGHGIDNVIVTHPTYGTASFSTGGAGDTWFSPQLSTRFGGIALMNEPLNPEGCFPWGPNGNHINIPCGEEMGYVLDSELLTRYDFSPARGGGGLTTEPAPRARWEPADSEVASMVQADYDLYDHDGTLLAAGNALQGSITPPWANAPFYQNSPIGAPLSATFGGKIWGNIVGYSASQNAGAFPEADRMNLEWAELRNMFERVRTFTSTAQQAQTLKTWACPVCHGPTAVSPEFTRRGYCRQHANIFAVSNAIDARTYFEGPTIKAGAGNELRFVRQPTADDWVQKRFTYAWAPEDYQERATYQTASGRGQPTNAPRFFAQHINFGTYSGGAFTASQTISAVEASQARTVGPGRIKAIFPSGYTYGDGGVTFRATLERGDGQTETQLFTVANGDGRAAGDAWGTYIPINRRAPAHILEDRSGVWDGDTGLYNKVTALEVVAGTSGDVQFSLVNASPHLHSSNGITISAQQSTPYANEWEDSIRRNPDLWHGPSRKTYLAYRGRNRRIEIQQSRDGGRTWTAPSQVTSGTMWDYPAVEKRITGELIVHATRAGNPSVVKTWRSRSDGSGFASMAHSFVGARPDVAPGRGLLQHLAVYSGAMQYYRLGVNQFSQIVSRPSATATGSSLETDTPIHQTRFFVGSINEQKRAAIVQERGGLLTAIENIGGNIRFLRSRTNGLGWESQPVSLANSVDPELAQGVDGREYHVARSGTRQFIRRGLNALSTNLGWNSQLAAGGTTVQTSSVIATGVDAERAAVLKLRAWGRPVIGAVTVGGTIQIHESKDDGLSWTQKA